jgi:hypothetical protein
LVFVAPPEERLDEPELVRRDEAEVDRAFVVERVPVVDRDFVPEVEPPLLDLEAELEPLPRGFEPELELEPLLRVFVPEVEPPLLDLLPELEPPLRDFVLEPERLVREEDDPPLRDFVPELEPELEPLRREFDDDRPRPCDCCCEPPESPSSPVSSSEPRSFLPTPTAAAVASPTAAPATTFFGVDISSRSEPSSSAIGQSPFASLKDVMNRGTILSRTISGPFFATHVPAAPAASSASGMTASRAASQPPDAIDVSSVLEPPFSFFEDASSPFDDPPPFDECDNALRAAIAAAPVTAAAAAAFTAVRAPEPPLSVVSSTSFVSFSAIVLTPSPRTSSRPSRATRSRFRWSCRSTGRSLP